MPGAPALGQGGQQPILNDALSYLDQVKVQFADQPDVYNRFLDIMKDFKSQAIDTPGVINRVSELFAGHPNLIQGFNTFLPPGYRIECGAGNDPNTIRVTTPMGTTVQSITGTGRALPDAVMVQGGPGGGYYGGQRPGNWQQQQQPQHSIESPEGVFSPQNQNQPPPYNQTPGQHTTYEAQQAVHQQQQRGVSQLTSAVATLGHPPRNTQTPTPGGQPGMNGGAQPGLEKRGPVEFNHAISYVNKIKNRFQDRPEIYKQFLEILQTYQRESKPIQDVYAQVTTLFNTAPDLLEDFKQFLPESAAQAKAAAAAKAMEEAQQNQLPQNHGARESKMPPVGNFQVPQNSKETKKRPRNSGVAAATSQPVVGESSRSSAAQGVPANKRIKTSHKPNGPDGQAVSPNLTPIIPEPMPPTSTAGASQEELAFFDRVKKYIGNKSTMNEFLKLCNMFSQDLIDRNVLVNKVSQFVGGNQDLIRWFKDFVGYEGNQDNVENQPLAPSGRVALSNCRGLGPSYRLLPKRERLKPCSGRDEMCRELLNDDWASHPTWASEDSGFVAHRKNLYEDALSRIEEERHDYDFNIEANSKVIQVLEPIAQSILTMTEDQRVQFNMPTGFQANSQSLYRRVFKKIYGDRGLEVVEDLFRDPSAVLPVVLARLKQKDEEWRFTQREWEKVWQAQTQNMYLKSLDHQGLNVKTADKKNLSAKHLVDAIKTRSEEQRRQRATLGTKKVEFQFIHDVSDMDVVLNVLRFMVVYVKGAVQHNASERRRIREFFEKFVSIFFGIPHEQIIEATTDVDRDSPEDDSEEITPTELPNGRSKRSNGKKTDLRRGVLDRSRNGTKGKQDDSAPGSKESTPDESAADDDDAAEAAEDQAVHVSDERWVKRSASRPGPSITEMNADEPYIRESYKLWANQNIFVFFSIFYTLYRRLKDIKDSESEAVDQANRAALDKPAKLLDYISSRDNSPLVGDETYFSRALLLTEEYVKGDVDENTFQTWYRRHFLMKGWKAFTILDHLKTLTKLGAVCSSGDSKEKTSDLIRQFFSNRQTEETTYNIEINLRKQADKWMKDSELFLIEWNSMKKTAGIRWLQRDDTTFDLDEMTAIDQWKYYVSSYFRVEPTEGVPRERMHKAVLLRNLPTSDADFEEGSGREIRAGSKEELIMRIAVQGYEIKFEPPPNEESLIFTNKPFGDDPSTGKSYARERLQPFENIRTERFKEKFEMNNAWMKGKSRDEVAQINDQFNKWIKDGITAASSSSVPAPDAMAVDDAQIL